MYIFLFLFPFFIYLFTLCPTIYAFDSPEIITTTFFLSIPHPTGYPLYLLFSKLFCFLPVGNIAFRCNLSSAFFGALTIIIIYLIILRLLNNRFIATFSSVIFAFANVFWYQATITEVYTFNILLFSLLFLSILNFYKTTNIKFLYLFSFIFGLTLSNTFLILTFLPAFLFLLLKNLKINKLINLLFLFLCGIIIYSYLPIRTSFDYNFARFDLSSISNFLNFIKAEGYQEVSIDISRYIIALPIVAKDIILQFTIIGLFFIIYGIYVTFKKDRNLVITLLVIILINAIFSFPALFSFDIKAFFLPTFLSFIILFSLGIEKLIKNYKELVIASVSITLLLLIITNYYKNNKSNYYFIYNLANNILNNTEKNSIIISANSSTYLSFSLIYLKEVERKREDVKVIYPMYLREEKYREYLKKIYPELKITDEVKKLPSNFFKVYYNRHKLMSFLNIITNGAVNEGIENHYKCIYIAEDIINKNFQNYNIYLLNNEIYETCGINLKNNYYLTPKNNFLFKLQKNYESVIVKIPKIEYKDDLTYGIYKNYYLELTKAYNYLNMKKVAHNFYDKAKELDKRIDKFDEVIEKNYRGISDKAMKEYIEYQQSAINNQQSTINTLTLATTTSVYDSGLLDYIIPLFEKKYNCKVKILAVGTGQAIRIAKDDNCDVILTHDKEQEEEFIRQGYGKKRYELMHNYFVLVGPKEKKIIFRNSKNIMECFRKIYQHNLKFISRGDNSGTHQREELIWKLAHLTPFNKNWYIETGADMSHTLRVANQYQAICLTDLSTFTIHQKELDLDIIYQNEKEKLTLNQYAIIPVASSKKYQLVNKLVKFLMSEDIKKLINNFGKEKYRMRLFYY